MSSPPCNEPQAAAREVGRPDLDPSTLSGRAAQVVGWGRTDPDSSGRLRVHQ